MTRSVQLEGLPLEMQFKILAKTSLADLMSMRQTSKNARDLVDSFIAHLQRLRKSTPKQIRSMLAKADEDLRAETHLFLRMQLCSADGGPVPEPIAADLELMLTLWESGRYSLIMEPTFADRLGIKNARAVLKRLRRDYSWKSYLQRHGLPRADADTERTMRYQSCANCLHWSLYFARCHSPKALQQVTNEVTLLVAVLLDAGCVLDADGNSVPVTTPIEDVIKQVQDRKMLLDADGRRQRRRNAAPVSASFFTLLPEMRFTVYCNLSVRRLMALRAASDESRRDVDAFIAQLDTKYQAADPEKLRALRAKSAEKRTEIDAFLRLRLRDECGRRVRSRKARKPDRLLTLWKLGRYAHVLEPALCDSLKVVDNVHVRHASEIILRYKELFNTRSRSSVLSAQAKCVMTMALLDDEMAGAVESEQAILAAWLELFATVMLDEGLVIDVSRASTGTTVVVPLEVDADTVLEKVRLGLWIFRC